MQDPFEDFTPILTVEPDGTKQWRNKDGELHRPNGPAIEYPDGSKWWYRNGQLHREDGPAVDLALGIRWWCRDGKLDREDGPAFERPDGIKQWYLKGKLLTEQEITDLQDRPAALIRQQQEEERQTRSATDIQELLRRKSHRRIRFNK
jgi:hypothetical protein